MPSRTDSDVRIVRASELAAYLYCRRAWWLHAIRGVEPENQRELAAGTAGHARHGLGVALAAWLQRLAALALALSLLAALAWYFTR
jgi:hypothetical protein